MSKMKKDERNRFIREVAELNQSFGAIEYDLEELHKMTDSQLYELRAELEEEQRLQCDAAADDMHPNETEDEFWEHENFD